MQNKNPVSPLFRFDLPGAYAVAILRRKQPVTPRKQLLTLLLKVLQNRTLLGRLRRVLLKR